jgi:hypothetical protein
MRDTSEKLYLNLVHSTCPTEMGDQANGVRPRVAIPDARLQSPCNRKNAKPLKVQSAVTLRDQFADVHVREN